jgi:hypothetical protein
MAPPSVESAASPAERADKDDGKAAKPAAAEASKTGASSGSAASAKAAGSGDSPSIMVRIVPGITRYHKEDCLLIRFLAADDLELMSLKAAADEGYFACKACKPDQITADTGS